MRKSKSFRTKLMTHILLLVSATLIIGTVLVVSLVKNELFEQNERYTLSAFVKTDTELENLNEQVRADSISLSAALAGTGIFRADISSDLSFTKALINVSSLFDEYTDYDMLGLIGEDLAIASSPNRSFSAQKGADAVLSSALYRNILYGDKEYGTAYLYEFLEDSAQNLPASSAYRQSKIIYFKRHFQSGGRSYCLLIGLRESDVHQMYLHLEQDVNTIYIVNGEGRILSSSNPGLFQTTLSYSSEISQEQSTYKKDLDGKEFQIVQYPLNIYDWTIINQYPTSEYMRDVNRMSFLIVLIFSFCLIAVAVSITIIIRRLSSPLDELSSRMKSLPSTGLAPAQYPPKATNIDEFDILNASFSQMANDIQHLITLQKEEEAKKNQLRLQALMAQINPHFICNALNTVKVMAEISGAQNAATMIQHICQYITPAFRTNKNRWTYAEEYAFLSDYIYILEIRFNARLEIRSDFDHSLDGDMLPRFLIQPLIENSVYHGMSQARPLEIDVSVRKEDGWVRIAVSDNGTGFPPEELEKTKQMLSSPEEEASVELQAGIGLRNIKQRLNHYLPGRHTVDLYSVPDRITTITIQIPDCPNNAASARNSENSR